MNSEQKFKSYYLCNNINSILYTLETEINISSDDIEVALPNAIDDLERFKNSNLLTQNEIFEIINAEILTIKYRLNKGTLPDINERLEWLSIIEENLIGIFEQKGKEKQPKIQLTINAPANVIYDLFNQLMNNDNSIENGKPILSQSPELIASFLKENIAKFSETSIQTIVKEISRKQLIKKSRLELKVRK